MSISVRDRKLLWGRSGNQCASTGCLRMLLVVAEESGEDAVVSQEAHIVAKEPEGPRGDSPLSPQERDSYPNLILLCLAHHKIVDDDEAHWTVGRLEEMKRQHEEHVETAMTPDGRQKFADELLYATAALEMERKADFASWSSWTSGLLQPTPNLFESELNRLEELRSWLYTRPWQGPFQTLKKGSRTAAGSLMIWP